MMRKNNGSPAGAAPIDSQSASTPATSAEERRLNQKYGAFWVSSYSKTLGKYHNIGKPHQTIRAPLDECKRLEGGTRYGGQFLFIECGCLTSPLVRGERK